MHLVRVLRNVMAISQPSHEAVSDGRLDIVTRVHYRELLRRVLSFPPSDRLVLLGPAFGVPDGELATWLEVRGRPCESAARGFGQGSRPSTTVPDGMPDLPRSTGSLGPIR